MYSNEELSEREKREAEERLKEKLAAEVTEDFESRREERRSVESGWLLDINFLSGNQYCDISPRGGVVDEDKQFYWQSRRVFNHIAPTVETRVAKLTKLRPVLRVRAFSDEEEDVKSAKLATSILAYVRERAKLNEVTARATLWSETCGTAFYKVVWDEKGGRQVAVDENGEPVYEGEVCVSAVPPFEIFPDNLATESMEEIHSLIHARAVSVEYIYEKFGVLLPGRDLEELGYGEFVAGKTQTKTGFNRTTAKNAEILIERYTKPSAEFPEGKLEIVAGGKLLLASTLPYRNGEREERGFPFVKQDCLRLPGAFFAGSVVDRLIPVQRAYNAVRNRKHEFLNRVSLGVLAVEDGSVDADELADEGLPPGKVLVYRQGGKAPEMLDFGGIPAEFAAEEEWLEREFSTVSGVSDLSQNSTPAKVTSASGLQLLLSQDDSRLAATTDNLASAMKEMGRQILRLYRQFAGNARLLTIAGENKRTQVYYFNASELSSNDVVFETEDAVGPDEKKETLLKLFEAGLLSDENGKLSEDTRNRVLEAFGFGSYENARDISALHIAKAEEENLALRTKDVEPDSYDEHELHVVEHTRFLLSSEFLNHPDEKVKKRFESHIAAHERRSRERSVPSGE